MTDVVADAVGRLSRDDWWGGVHRALDELGPNDLAELHGDQALFDVAAGDGLDS